MLTVLWRLMILGIFSRLSKRIHCSLALNLNVLCCLSYGFTEVYSQECLRQSYVKTALQTRSCTNFLNRNNPPPSEHSKIMKMSLDIRKAPIGLEIRGVDLKGEVSEELIQKFREDVYEHKLLIFKDQGVIPGDRHVEISRWFGELESTFYKHPRSPHPDVFRVSNDHEEGCRNVGRTGWHIDGSFMPMPFGFALYHMFSVPKIGSTDFVPLDSLISSLSDETRKRWDRLWMMSDRRAAVSHPLIYTHPATKLLTLCFHLGMVESFVWDMDTDEARETDREETIQIKKEIHKEITKDNRQLIYSHKWEVGDFIISDNLAVGHEAAPETQYPVSEVGLRVLHRTTVRGMHRPQK